MVKGKNFISLKDFRLVKDVYLKEKLTQEELAEGQEEPFEDLFKVCFTGHAYKRINDEQDRFCSEEDILSLIISKTNQVINVPQNEDFILLRDDEKLAIVALVSNCDGYPAIIIKTVIRKVFIDEAGQEQEKHVFIDKSKNTVF